MLRHTATCRSESFGSIKLEAVMPANVFEWDGWQGQLARAHRWHDRFLEVANKWNSHSLDEQIDFALVFFQNAYQVRDYLQYEQVVPQHSLDELMSRSFALRIARDLTNGSKHRSISRPSVDPSPWILRTLNFGRDPRLTLKAGSELLDLESVARDCLNTWQIFLDQQVLDPGSMSPARQALFDALRAPTQALPTDD